MGFFDGLLDTLTLGAYSAVSDLLSTPKQIWDENRQVSNQKELSDYSTQNSMRLQEHQASLSKDVFDYQFNKQMSANSSLMRNSPSIQKGALLSAGINPATEFGTFSGNVASPSAPVYGASSPSGQAQIGVSSLPLSDVAESLLITEKAKGQKIENQLKARELKGKNEADTIAQALGVTHTVETDDSGNRVYFNITTAEGLEQYKKMKELPTFFARLDADKAQAFADKAQALLAKKVADGQFKNNSVVNSLVNLPVNQQKKILSDVALAMSHVGLNLQKIEESKASIELMMSQKQLNEVEAYIKAHDTDFALFTSVFGKEHEGVSAACALVLGLVKSITGVSARIK